MSKTLQIGTKDIGRDRLATIDDDTLIDLLPHGSGIDHSWSIDRLKNGHIVCRNSYHGMDENGYYDGWQDFSVKLFAVDYPDTCPQCDGRGYRTIGEIATIRKCRIEDIDRDSLHVEWIGSSTFRCWSCNPIYNPQIIDYRLSFTGYRVKRNWAYGLRDCLEETIGYSLRSILRLHSVD